MILNKRYNPQDYPTYDNYPAIEVSKAANIPIDFMGLMGVPITALDMPGFMTAFELIGLSGIRNMPGLPGGKLMLNGKAVYKRLFIRKRQLEPSQIYMSNEEIVEEDTY